MTVADFGPSIKTRYAEAYTAAHGVSSIGEVIKVIGLVILAIGVLGIMAAMGESNQDGYGAAVGGTFFGMLAMVGAFVSISGIMLAAQAQLNLSALDCAVHTSPFLNETQRADIMRLRVSPRRPLH
ncbi:MAG TPA: hypothetical protein VFR37_19810 [Longimicrobium sp.]|nr:hypothetical protein [Longimicrobium sp.]